MPRLYINGCLPRKKRLKSSGDSLCGRIVKFLTDDGPGIGRVKAHNQDGTLDVELALPDGTTLVVTKSCAAIPVESCVPIDGLTVTDGDIREFHAVVDSVKRLDDAAGKAFTEVKQGDVVLDYQNVAFEGYASTFVNVTASDRDGDYIQPYAFKDTLSEFKSNPVMLTDHRNAVSNLVGSYDRIGTNDRGLFVRGTVSNAPDEYTKRIRFLIVEGHLKTMSIGGFLYYGADGRGVEKARLFEISLTPIPANQDALFYVKALTIKAACSAFKNFKF